MRKPTKTDWKGSYGPKTLVREACFPFSLCTHHHDTYAHTRFKSQGPIYAMDVVLVQNIAKRNKLKSQIAVVQTVVELNWGGQKLPVEKY